MTEQFVVLQYMNKYKLLDGIKRKVGKLGSTLRRYKDEEGSPVVKKITKRGPHGFTYVTNEQKAIDWVKKRFGVSVELIHDEEDEKQRVSTRHDDNGRETPKLIRFKNKLVNTEQLKKHFDALTNENKHIKEEMLRLKIESDIDELFSLGEILEKSVRYKAKRGIYFLIRNLEIVYVGQSINIPSRIQTHLNEGSKKFDRVSYVYLEHEDLDYFETAYILKFRPYYNKSVNGSLCCPMPIKEFYQKYDTAQTQIPIVSNF